MELSDNFLNMAGSILMVNLYTKTKNTNNYSLININPKDKGHLTFMHLHEAFLTLNPDKVAYVQMPLIKYLWYKIRYKKFFKSLKYCWTKDRYVTLDVNTLITDIEQANHIPHLFQTMYFRWM